MKLFRKKIGVISVLLIVLAVFIVCTEVKAASDPFPLYACIQPNVEFWKKIYSEYPSDKGVMHDNRRLDIIYGVIELKNPDVAGGRKINRKRIKKARKKFKAILAKLMRGKSPSGPAEQHVADLFGPSGSGFFAAQRDNRLPDGPEGSISPGCDPIRSIY